MVDQGVVPVFLSVTERVPMLTPGERTRVGAADWLTMLLPVVVLTCHQLLRSPVLLCGQGFAL
jgi:hypothetical protein